MRRITIALVCAMIAPLAFAQTKPEKTKHTTAAQPATPTEAATANTAGTIRTYQAGKTIVVDTTQGPVSFAMGSSARIVNNAGKVVASELKPGQRVRVYYTGTDQNRAVDRVVVED
jgi:hypothetical protein